MLILYIQRFPKSYTCEEVTIIFRTFINFALEKNPVKHAGPGSLSTEVMQCVIGHVYLTPLYSSDHSEGKWREAKADHIRDTTAITQRFGTEDNSGASNLANVSSKWKCQLLILLEFTTMSISMGF